MDVRKLKEHCEAALPLIDNVGYSKPAPKLLLKSLLEKTIELVDSGINGNDIMFTTIEMVELLKNNVTEQQAKKFKSDHYAETEILLDKINKLKNKQGYSDSKFILELSDTGEIGGAKNKKHHFIKLIEIKKTGKDTSKESDLNFIEYEPVQLPKPSWFAKPFMSIELSSWRLSLFLFIPISAMIIGYVLFIKSIFTPTDSELIAFLIFIAVVTFIGHSIFPFYEAHHLRIAIAPQWMIKWNQITGQVESLKLDKLRKSGRPYRKLEFVIYEGKCPICHNVVEIKKGRRQFKGRLVGICNESPREHVFSFDHVKEIGTRL